MIGFIVGSQFTAGGGGEAGSGEFFGFRVQGNRRLDILGFRYGGFRKWGTLHSRILIVRTPK